MLQRKEQLELERQILNKTDLLIELAMETSMLVGEERERKLENGIQIVCEMASLLQEYLGGHPEHFETLLGELTRQKLPDENVLQSFGDFNLVLDTAIKKGLERYLNMDQEVPDPEPVPEPRQDLQDTWETGDGQAPVEEISETMVSDENAHTAQASLEKEPVVDAVETEGTETQEQVLADTSELQEESFVEIAETVCSQCDPGQDSWDLALKQLFPGATISKDYSLKGLTFSYFLPEKAIAIDIAPTDKREAIWKEYYCRQERIRLLSLPAVGDDARPRQIVRTIRQYLAQIPG
ncbi:MAG: hypothetical protein GX750_01495 [Clostridia bacterium]|nr:hypothetical protein [Clostridia bacterium]